MEIEKKLSDYKENFMSGTATASNALANIKFLKKKIIFIVKNYKLKGTVTDGDLRKAYFLNTKKVLLKDIMNKNPKVIKNGVKNFNDQDVFKIKYIPILKKDNTVIDILNLSPNKKIQFENNVVIFAGGHGKRLLPFTKKIPKPMLKIKKKPNLETLIIKIGKSGFKKITLTLFYKNQYIKKKLNNEKINFYTEKKPLGTCGSLKKIKFTNKLPIIAINSDLITDLDLKNLMFFHNSNKSDFTISLKDKSFQIPFASVTFKKNKIFNIEEKPKRNYFFNAGIYMLNQKVINLIKKDEKIDMPDLIKRALKRNYRVLPFYMFEKWLDYGTIEEYLKVRK